MSVPKESVLLLWYFALESGVCESTGYQISTPKSYSFGAFEVKLSSLFWTFKHDTGSADMALQLGMEDKGNFCWRFLSKDDYFKKFLYKLRKLIFTFVTQTNDAKLKPC